MRPWSVAVALVALCAAVAGALLLSLRTQANAESETGALVLAQRARTEPAKPAAASNSTTPPAPPTTVSAAAAAPASAGPAPAPLPSVAAAGSAALPTEAEPGVSFRKTATYNGAAVYVPESCHGDYDVVLHFHGAHPYVKDLLEKAKLNVVGAVFNAGDGAEKYSAAFQAGGTLSSLLHQIELAAAPLCGGTDAKPRRVALTAWSAGYGAVEKLLSRAEDRERVDAALLADGLHAGFTDRYRRTLAPNALQAFRDFGELAIQGKKLFAITHSSIVTDGYGSTTECSRFLLKAVNVPCDDALVSGKSGNFSIEGFTGNDKAAHILQFRQMYATLLSKLRERWQN